MMLRFRLRFVHCLITVVIAQLAVVHSFLSTQYRPTFVLQRRLNAAQQVQEGVPSNQTTETQFPQFSSEPLSSVIFDNLPDNYTLVSPAADVLEMEPNQRLVCIGDVHGDFDAMEEFLTIAGVYDAYSSPGEEWCGGNTILVQCGDIMDRGSHELACLRLLTKLSQQAVATGGSVICLLGNHEPLNCLGFFQDATTDEEYERLMAPVVDKSLMTRAWRLQYVANQPARWATFEPGSGILCKSLMANMKVAVKVGRTLCVHAGLTTSHLREYGSISDINERAQQWMTQIPPNVTINNEGKFDDSRQALVEAAARQEAYIKTMPPFLHGASTPLWMRDYSFPHDSQPKNPLAQSMIDDVLEELDCDRMVVGHTVQRQINCALQGKAWRIDVGASRGVMGGKPEVLEVTKRRDGTELVAVLTRQAGEETIQRLAGTVRRLS